MMIFSQRLKWLREKKGFTQKEMAEKLGISQQYYGRFEKGAGQPNLETLFKLRYILGESLDFLLGVYLEDYLAEELYDEYIEARMNREDAEHQLKVVEELYDESSPNFESHLNAIVNIRSRLQQLKSKEENALNKFFDYLTQIPGIDGEYAQKEFWIKRYETATGEQDSYETKLIRSIEEIQKDAPE